MSDVIIPLNYIADIMKQAQSVIDAALSVADDVPAILRSAAIEYNEDNSGNAMNKKKPRPKSNPTNHPETPLIQNDTPDLMNPERWRTQRVSSTEVHVIFNPPEHQKYLETKAPDRGGRRWITKDQINPGAASEISRRMRERAVKALRGAR